jgi:hypothetical protein
MRLSLAKNIDRVFHQKQDNFLDLNLQNQKPNHDILCFLA